MADLILPRRKFLAGITAIIAAPAIVRAASLMPVKVIERSVDFDAAAYIEAALIAKTKELRSMMEDAFLFGSGIAEVTPLGFRHIPALQFNTFQSPLQQGMGLN